MSQIEKELIDVGYNQATVKMDVESLVRESMIKLFKITDENGNPLDPYDDTYFDKGLPSSSEPGMATLIKQYILLEGKILGFVFQQYLYMLKPIQSSLELPNLLSNPKQLTSKIKEIIEGLEDLINDVNTFFTDTEKWFTDNILKEFSDINVPLPEIPLNLLEFEIKIPSIDNLKLFDNNTWKSKGLPNPYSEKLTNEVLEIKKNLKDLRTKLQKLKDKINPDINTLQISMVNTLIGALSLLYSTLYEEEDSFNSIMLKIHEQILKKQSLLINQLSKTQKSSYKIIDYTNDINNLISKSTGYTESNYLKTPLNPDSLETLSDKISEMIDDEEQSITDMINRYQLTKNASFIKKINDINNIISDLYLESKEYEDSINTTKSEINTKKESIDLMNQSLKSVLLASPSLLEDNVNLQKEINSLKKKLGNLSPGSDWLESQTDLIIGVIRSPFDFIINLLSKLFEGILELLQQLPLPKFTKIKEFFSDLINIPNIDKMKVILTDILQVPSDLTATVENVMTFLPWLTVTTASTFITSVVEPLPIPIY